MPFRITLTAAPAVFAALSLVAMPAQAAVLPAAQTQRAVHPTAVWSPGDDTAEHRRWRRHHRDGVDAGDVLAGVLVLGGIAAIASAASNDHDSRDDDRNYRDDRDSDWRGEVNNGFGESRGLDAAAELCVAEIERDQRVASVDTINRDADGWRVTGSLYNGSGFRCTIGSDGRISDIDTGGGSQGYYSGEASYPAAGDGQYEDDRYAAARARIDDGYGSTYGNETYPRGPEEAGLPPPSDYEAGGDYQSGY